MKLHHALAAAAIALSAAPASAVTIVWNPTSWDVSRTDFNNASQTFAGVTADELELDLTNIGSQVHSHGGPMTWSINATIDGVLTTIYTGSFAASGTTFMNPLPAISFGQGVVTSLGFTSSPGQNQSYHGFLDGATYGSQAMQFSLNAVGNAVPEPGVWAMLIVGFGLVGGAMRQRRRQTVRVAYS